MYTVLANSLRYRPLTPAKREACIRCEQYLGKRTAALTYTDVSEECRGETLRMFFDTETEEAIGRSLVLSCSILAWSTDELTTLANKRAGVGSEGPKDYTLAEECEFIGLSMILASHDVCVLREKDQPRADSTEADWPRRVRSRHRLDHSE